jgi:hypothetical protein
MLVADALPFLNKFSDKPLIYSVFWKTGIYSLCGFIFIMVERMAALSDGGYLEPDGQRELAIAFLKDLAMLALPQLATALAVYDIATYGYDKYVLSSARGDIVDLLVENGEWDVPPDGSKGLPTLHSVKYTVDGKNVLERVTDVTRLAKLLSKDTYPDGIMLARAARFVNPREALCHTFWRPSGSCPFFEGLSVLLAVAPATSRQQVLRRKLGIAVHHLPRLPAAQVLELVAGRSRLPMPRRPGMPQVVEAEIVDAGLPYRGVPSVVGELPRDRPSPVGEADPGMVPALALQHRHRIFVQRDASRRSILGPVEPSCLTCHIDSVPVQPDNLTGPAARR